MTAHGEIFTICNSRKNVSIFSRVRNAKCGAAHLGYVEFVFREIHRTFILIFCIVKKSHSMWMLTEESFRVLNLMYTKFSMETKQLL